MDFIQSAQFLTRPLETIDVDQLLKFINSVSLVGPSISTLLSSTASSKDVFVAAIGHPLSVKKPFAALVLENMGGIQLH
jgi:hypothetical protein